MESYSSLIEAFEALNQRKREDPKALSESERGEWKKMRRQIEQALFTTEPDAAADTREFLRVPVSLAVRYWTRHELKDRYISVLGEGGLFVATVDPLPIGSKLDLEVVLAEKGFSFLVKGEVVWVNHGDDPAKRGMGIRFINLTYEQKRIVYNLVDDSLRERLLERRKFARVDAKLQVQFVYSDGFFDLQTVDASMGGLFISAEQALPLGDKIRLVLQIPGEPAALKAVAEVVRVVDSPRPGQPKGFGVRFVNLEPGAAECLRRYLSQRLTARDGSPEGEIEHQKQPRLKYRVKLCYQAANAVGASYSRDISTGGVFIQTHDPPAKGQKVQVSLIHPVTLKTLALVGTVVRVVELDPSAPERVPGVGLVFDQMSPEKETFLKQFLTDFASFEGGGVGGDEPDPAGSKQDG